MGRCKEAPRSTIQFRIDADLKKEWEAIMEAEGKYTGKVLREFIEKYINARGQSLPEAISESEKKEAKDLVVNLWLSASLAERYRQVVKEAGSTIPDMTRKLITKYVEAVERKKGKRS